MDVLKLNHDAAFEKYTLMFNLGLGSMNDGERDRHVPNRRVETFQRRDHGRSQDSQPVSSSKNASRTSRHSMEEIRSLLLVVVVPIMTT